MYSAFRNVLCPQNKWHSMASTEPLKLAAKNGEPKGGFGANFPFQLSRESAKERKLKITMGAKETITLRTVNYWFDNW